MASDHEGARRTEVRRIVGAERTPEAASVARAARRRSLSSTSDPARSPRVEVYLNELTGTMSWRTIEHSMSGRGQRQNQGTGRRTPEAAPWSAHAAALRSAGLDPSRAPAKGAAPIPTHPAAVRAAVSVDTASLTPEQQQRHLARLGALRSGVTADLARGTRMPTPVASRLRSTSATPAHAHALTERHAAGATRPPTPGAPVHRPSR